MLWVVSGKGSGAQGQPTDTLENTPGSNSRGEPPRALPHAHDDRHERGQREPHRDKDVDALVRVVAQRGGLDGAVERDLGACVKARAGYVCRHGGLWAAAAESDGVGVGRGEAESGGGGDEEEADMYGASRWASPDGPEGPEGGWAGAAWRYWPVLTRWLVYLTEEMETSVGVVVVSRARSRSNDGMVGEERRESCII